MLLKLAWRNIWRSKLRSFVVIGAIAIGIWALLFLQSFSQGMVSNYIDEGISVQTAHIQIHHPDFKEDREMKYVIPNSNELLSFLAKEDGIQSATPRVINTGMIATSKTSRGINIVGVDNQTEGTVSSLSTKLIEGEYLPEGKKNTILISQKIADKLGVKLKSKLVLTFPEVNQDITSGAFRVSGIFKTSNAQYDQMNVFVKQADLKRLSKVDDGTSHEIAMLLDNIDDLQAVKQNIQEKYPAVLVETYEEISPDLALFSSQMELSIYIMTTIFMLALIFGIINTMLMAVLERIKELGMLMAIGMNKIKVFFMIVIETLLLALIGGPIGMLLAWLTVAYTSRTGIDLSNFAKGMEGFGMSAFVRPSLSSSSYIIVAVAIMITAVLASLYPARKATKLKPVDALRAF